MSPRSISDRPTIARLGGAGPLRGPAVSGEPWDLSRPLPEETIFSETKRWAKLQAVISDGWKLVFDKAHQESTLYNVRDDPLEQRDVSAEEIARLESMNQRRRDIEKRIAQIREQLRIEKKRVALSPTQVEQMKNLGYLE
jgi:hypothetical protein